jgi:hypothetical protein
MKNDNLIKEGSVIISIKEYDHLRQFKQDILDGHVIKMWGYWDHFEIAVQTVDEQLKEINLINKNLGERNDSLKKMVDELENELGIIKEEIKIKDEFYKKHSTNKFWNWIIGK